MDASAARRIEHFATRLIRLARTSRKGLPISSGQYSVLALLEFEPGISVVELARRETVAHPTMSRLISKLEKADLVHRTRDPDDRRSSLVSLTSKGQHLYREVSGRRERLFDLLLGQLSKQTVNEILTLVDRDGQWIEDALRQGKT